MVYFHYITFIIIKQALPKKTHFSAFYIEIHKTYEYIYKLTVIYGLQRSEVCDLHWRENDTITFDHTAVQCEVDGKRILATKNKMKNQASISCRTDMIAHRPPYVSCINLWAGQFMKFTAKTAKEKTLPLNLRATVK